MLERGVNGLLLVRAQGEGHQGKLFFQTGTHYAMKTAETQARYC
jgi:hypothetical protein